jgi:hypothetical protein
MTRDQFAEVFGNQSAAAGAATTYRRSASGPPASGDASTGTTTTAAVSEPIPYGTAPNDNEPTVTEDAQNTTEPEKAPADTLLVDTAPEPTVEPEETPPPDVAPDVSTPVSAVEAPEEAANDNGIGIEELPATGTE